MKQQQGIAHLALILVIVVLAVVGFAGYQVVSKDESTVSTREEVDKDTEELAEIPLDLEGVKTVDEIRELSLAELPEGEIVSVELELEHGTLIYKVTFADGTVKMYDAKTGEVYVDDHEDGDDEGESEDELKENGEAFNPNKKVGLTVANAIAIAREQFPGSRVEKVEVEVEDGVVVFSVRFTNDARVDVDSDTGEVVRTEQPKTEDDKEDDDKSNSDSSDESDDD